MKNVEEWTLEADGSENVLLVISNRLIVETSPDNRKKEFTNFYKYISPLRR